MVLLVGEHQLGSRLAHPSGASGRFRASSTGVLGVLGVLGPVWDRQGR